MTATRLQAIQTVLLVLILGALIYVGQAISAQQASLEDINSTLTYQAVDLRPLESPLSSIEDNVNALCQIMEAANPPGGFYGTPSCPKQ